MQIEGGTLRLEADDYGNTLVTDLTLPDGTATGGLLLRDENARFIVLFGHTKLKVRDEVVGPRELAYVVTDVRHLSMNGQPVTALEVEPDADGARGAPG